MIYALLGFAVVALGVAATFGGLAIGATRRAGDEKARGDVLAVRLEVAIANGKNESNRADFQQRRADALDAALVRAVAVGPVDGAFDRLLQARDAATDRAAGRGGAPALPDTGDASSPAAPSGPDELLKPGP